jgi:3-hydroxyacyl-CoA dehydrogenase
VEVKIGVQYASRELVLESGQSPEEVEEAVSAAIRSEMGLLTLQDEKGRRVLVPVNKLAYIEIAESEQRRVGFGAM